MKRALVLGLVLVLAALQQPSHASTAGGFSRHTYANAQGRLTYKVFTPSGPGARRHDLVVVLPGAGETADTAAHRSQWNSVARRFGFTVAYPEQNPAYDSTRKWDWATASRQGRGNREASLIAGITRTVMARQDVDPQHVFIMGISAGAGMAGAMAVVYPELYAALGLEVGCPFDNAGCGGSSLTPDQSAAAAVKAMGQRRRPLPVFNEYGGADPIAAGVSSRTVVAAWLTVQDTLDDGHDNGSVSRKPSQSRIAAPALPKKPYTVDRFRDRHGCLLAEDWVVEGQSHAWSGGRPTSSTDVVADPLGPDVTTAMYRFFTDRQTQDRDGRCG